MTRISRGRQTSDYVTSFYESIFKKTNRNNYLRKCVLWSVGLYLTELLFLLVFFWKFKGYINNEPMYFKASPILASIVFWPFLIICCSRKFHETYIALGALFSTNNPASEKAKLQSWYRYNARRTFTYLSQESGAKKAISIIGIILHILLIIGIGFLFVKNLFPNGEPTLLFIPAILSAFFMMMAPRYRNLSVTLFTICCGLSYYSYVYLFSNSGLNQLFTIGWANIIILVVVTLIFFIAGSTIYPMIGTLIAFYHDLPKTVKISIDPDHVSDSLSRIKKIKKFFTFMSIISLLAFFQLFGIVFFLGLFSSKYVLTIILFVLGSLFPLMMYFASDILFKRFMHGLYSDYEKTIGIDQKISEALNKGEETKVHQLLALKKKLSGQFEESNHINIQVVTALLTPIVTTVLSLIFPKVT